MLSTKKHKRRLVLVLLALIGILAVALLFLFSSVRWRGGVPLKTYLEVAEKRGIQSTEADNLSQDESIIISINSFERAKQESDFPYARIDYTVKNNTNRTLLVVSGGCCVECSIDGKKWYPLSNYHLDHIMDDGIMLYDMGWMISYSGGESDDLFLLEGDNSRSSIFYLDGAYPEEMLSSEEIPDGYYRLIIRLCEYVDPDEIFHTNATLIDYGYYSKCFQVKRGKLITN